MDLEKITRWIQRVNMVLALVALVLAIICMWYLIDLGQAFSSFGDTPEPEPAMDSCWQAEDGDTLCEEGYS